MLVETARRQAVERGHDLAFEVADCEALPYDDATYDVVTSSVGVIFAPDHRRVAAELARVLRPGGRLALTAWTTDGTIGEFFKVIGRFARPPAEGAGSSLSWGDVAYCEHLVGESAEDLWNEMAEAFGPIVVLLRTLDGDVAAAFRAEMIDLFGRLESDAGVVLPRPFLLVLGTKR